MVRADSTGQRRPPPAPPAYFWQSGRRRTLRTAAHGLQLQQLCSLLAALAARLAATRTPADDLAQYLHPYHRIIGVPGAKAEPSPSGPADTHQPPYFPAAHAQRMPIPAVVAAQI